MNFFDEIFGLGNIQKPILEHRLQFGGSNKEAGHEKQRLQNRFPQLQFPNFSRQSDSPESAFTFNQRKQK